MCQDVLVKDPGSHVFRGHPGIPTLRREGHWRKTTERAFIAEPGEDGR